MQCLRASGPWCQQKSQNQTMPPGIPGSSPFRPRFHPRFAHVSPTFRNNGAFFCLRCLHWLGPWHASLQFTALGMEFLRQFPAIFSGFWCPKLFNPGNSGHSSLDFWIIECIKPGIYSMSGSWSCVVVNKQIFLEFAVFRDPECMESRKT